MHNDSWTAGATNSSPSTLQMHRHLCVFSDYGAAQAAHQTSQTMTPPTCAPPVLSFHTPSSTTHTLTTPTRPFLLMALLWLSRRYDELTAREHLRLYAALKDPHASTEPQLLTRLLEKVRSRTPGHAQQLVGMMVTGHAHSRGLNGGRKCQAISVVNAACPDAVRLASDLGTWWTSPRARTLAVCTHMYKRWQTEDKDPAITRLNLQHTSKPSCTVYTNRPSGRKMPEERRVGQKGGWPGFGWWMALLARVWHC